MSAKADDAFRTISEVSELLDVPAHVLRFWESKFSMLRPLKRSGGRRYYRPDDVALLEKIRDLLYRDGFTIKGAQKHLTNPPASASGTAPSNASVSGGEPVSDAAKALAILTEARVALTALRSRVTG